ncbi:nadph:quinone oxidoreductase [Plasmopara halstedii]|uniref:Nadph:quinone oxidoreductase n=1 Tax=Plasmopara halstedii TaxID=4781 RepID=A0A0P1AR80_PLAHL|nr:nadph:quinone oxidoreductase [Plasmopara halstedii]CEG43777.1 nadph:quinone oxidoreductase [Plasmopara halstedii]|eukprot:XP_024580146.1 nadph:quinone oxidoreductase [Plasmopara halstedii]
MVYLTPVSDKILAKVTAKAILDVEFRVQNLPLEMILNTSLGILDTKLMSISAHTQRFVAVSSDYISKKPSNLTHVEAATLPMAALTALQSFRHGQLGENKKVLILGGAGGVGSMAIQVAKAVFKPQTIATTASTQKVERMRLLGADVVVDYKHNRFETELKDYDFALDTTGEAKQCLECVTRGGSVITIVATPMCSQARRAEILYDFMFVLANGDMMNEANMAMEYLESGRALGKVVVQLVDTTKAM